MNIIESIVLGIIQGLTEFLPISSSGHLALAQKMFGMQNAGFFLEALLHIGTLVAVFIAFRKLIAGLFKALFTMMGKIFRGKFSLKNAEPCERMLLMLIVSCLPLFVALIFKDKAEMLKDSLWTVGAALIVNSVILFVCDRLPDRKKDASNMGIGNSLAVGFMQAVAIIPGISRSGSTITAGVASGLDREFAAQYTFILSIPTILAGAAVSFKDAVAENAIIAQDIPAYIVGVVVSGVVGFFAIRLLQYIHTEIQKIYHFFGIQFRCRRGGDNFQHSKRSLNGAKEKKR